MSEEESPVEDVSHPVFVWVIISGLFKITVFVGLMTFIAIFLAEWYRDGKASDRAFQMVVFCFLMVLLIIVDTEKRS